MQTPRSVKLSESSIHMRPHGMAEFTQLDFNRIVMGDLTFVWDPGLDGIFGGEGFLEATPDQPGERHLDSNEVLYLASGAMSLRLEDDDGVPTDTSLQPGEAVIVPQGIWHRLIVDEPSRYLWFGSGRTELRKRRS